MPISYKHKIYTPESGWLTSYKRKLYMGRNIEWNQLFTNSVTSSFGITISQEQDGTIILNGTSNYNYFNFSYLSDAMNKTHKYLLCLKILNNPDKISLYYGWLNRNIYTDVISSGEICSICNQAADQLQRERSTGLSGFTAGTVFNNVKVRVMVMDLTQMFGAGNEPATPAEFWSYFDHKLYPYNAGETQPLFKISRKSQWGAAGPQTYTDCLTFTGKTSDFTLKATYKTWDGTLEWSTDHNTWTTLAGTEEMQSVGKKLYLRGKGNSWFHDSETHDSVIWVLSEKADCAGNIQTLLDWENPPISISAEYCYTEMFCDCTNLVTAPELPATTLAGKCYQSMFEDCINLARTPELPATTLARDCYWSMFSGCTNLTTAPELPATTLEENCYLWMFRGCSKLKVNTSSGNKIFTCPSIIPSNAVTDMFEGTGGTFTGTPTAGNTYYWGGVTPKSLEDSTWAEISQVSANKQWDAMGWKVGRAHV